MNNMMILFLLNCFEIITILLLLVGLGFLSTIVFKNRENLLTLENNREIHELNTVLRESEKEISHLRQEIEKYHGGDK